jgi:hypothetical protein
VVLDLFSVFVVLDDATARSSPLALNQPKCRHSALTHQPGI